MFAPKQRGTVIAKGLKIVGSVTAEGLVEVIGQIDGELHCTSLVIARGAHVNGIGIGDIGGEHLSLPGEELLLIGGERVPLGQLRTVILGLAICPRAERRVRRGLASSNRNKRFAWWKMECFRVVLAGRSRDGKLAFFADTVDPLLPYDEQVLQLLRQAAVPFSGQIVSRNWSCELADTGTLHRKRVHRNHHTNQDWKAVLPIP